VLTIKTLAMKPTVDGGKEFFLNDEKISSFRYVWEGGGLIQAFAPNSFLQKYRRQIMQMEVGDLEIHTLSDGTMMTLPNKTPIQVKFILSQEESRLKAANEGKERQSN
jgi:hypothetical protein